MPHFKFVKVCDSSSNWKCHKPGNKNFLKVKFNSEFEIKEKQIYNENWGKEWPSCGLMYADFSTNDRKITVGILPGK